jgi:histidine ammonia-lyase
MNIALSSRKSLEADGVFVSDANLTIEQVVAVAHRRKHLALSADPAYVAQIDAGAAFLDRLIERDGEIYGVTTGYGDSCTERVPTALVEQLSKHLYTFHGCGLGDHFDPIETRAILVARLSSLAKGFSGVRHALLAQIERLLKHDILPMIPKEGSVGASGDLTPLSYVAAVLAGEREVRLRGAVVPTATAFAEFDVKPLPLRPKEGLAVMNGTAVMTGLACLAADRARTVAKLASRITSMTSVAIDGNASHFDPRLFEVKPHPGQTQSANWIHDDLRRRDVVPKRLQDRYSTRCAPHVIGVLLDGLRWMDEMIECELNSANDNPIIDPERELVMHGGHFYGGHIAFAMDSLKNAVANVADLIDRQIAVLVDARYNNGLPANLSGATGPRAAVNHGFKAVQIGASAWTAEALKQTMPASVFSRSTECHNQDKVSMGTIAARDALRVIELTEQVLAAGILASRQAVALRAREGGLQLSSALEGWTRRIDARFEPLLEDRMLEPDLRALLAGIRAGELEPYPEPR